MVSQTPNQTQEEGETDNQEILYPFSSFWSSLQFLVQKLLVLRKCMKKKFSDIKSCIYCFTVSLFVPKLQSTSCQKAFSLNQNTQKGDFLRPDPPQYKLKNESMQITNMFCLTL